ncbi:MAG: ankyrin repeat domain-containing protein [Spirochaetota bacterium]
MVVNKIDNHSHNGLIWYLVSIRRMENIKILMLLLDKGININHQDNCGNTALHHIVKLNRYKEIIKLLLDNGADVNIRNKKGQTPLDLAQKEGDNEIIHLLQRYANKKVVGR